MMSFKHSVLALGVASAVALSGCGGGGSDGPGDPRLDVPQDPSQDQTEQQGFCESSTSEFSVTDFVPEAGATNVAVNTNIRITFNANIDAGSVPGNVRLLIDGANPVALEDGSPRVIGRSIMLNPLGDLAADSQYTIQADSGLKADCGDAGNKTLASLQSASFTTDDSGEQDTTGPTITSSSPENGDSLAARDTKVFVEFDEPIDPTSISASNFVVTELDSTGNEVETVSGVINPVGNSVEFTPNQPLSGQSFFKVSVGRSITDLAGNDLSEPGEFTFRTGGLVLALNDGVISQIPALGEGLNVLVGTLLDPLAFGNSEDGLNSLDNALILQIPLVDALADLLGGAANFTPPSTSFVNGVEFTDFTSAVVAVCDPKSTTNSEPGVDCTLALDLGLDLTQLASLADAFTGGNPEQVPDLLLGLLEGLASGDLSALPPELGNLFEADNGLGIRLKLVDDNGLPLPAPLEDGLVTVLDAAGQLPVLGTLFDQTDGLPLVDVGLLEGELLGVSAGGLVSIGILSGTETFIGPNGILNLGGALFDTLLELAPIDFAGGETPSPEDLPLIGDLLTLLDLGGFLDGDSDGFDPSNLPIIGTLTELFNLGDGGFGGDDIPVLGGILSMLDPSNIGEGDLPLIGDLFALLNPDTITDGDLPIIGELFNQLFALGQDSPLQDLPLVGDLLSLLESGAGDSPLGEFLDPSALEAIPVLGPVLNGLIGGLLGGLTGR